MTYKIIKKIIPEDLSSFLFQYLDLKANAVNFLYEKKILDPTEYLGNFFDGQIVGKYYSHYADFAVETLLIFLQKEIEKQLNKKLVPTYSYTRMYYKGCVMYRHKDRASCELSGTLNLGGDPWSIFIDPTGKDSIKGIKKNSNPPEPIIKKNAKKGKEIKLSPGDIMIYEGNKCEHWRNKFKGNKCGQVFLHYNYLDGKIGLDNLYDKRPLLGLRHSITDR